MLGIDVDRYTPSDQVPKDRPQQKSFLDFLFGIASMGVLG